MIIYIKYQPLIKLWNIDFDKCRNVVYYAVIVTHIFCFNVRKKKLCKMDPFPAIWCQKNIYFVMFKD